MLFVLNIKNLKNVKTLVLSIICSKYKYEDEKISKEEESIEILNILGLINNIEEYQEILCLKKTRIKNLD